MADGRSQSLFSACSSFSPALELKITSASALGAAAAGQQQFPAVLGKAFPKRAPCALGSG